MLLKSQAGDSSLLKHVGKLSCTNLYNVSVNPNAHSYFFSSLRPFNLEGRRVRPHPAQRQGDANASQAPNQQLVHIPSHRDAALYLP